MLGIKGRAWDFILCLAKIESAPSARASSPTTNSCGRRKSDKTVQSEGSEAAAWPTFIYRGDFLRLRAKLLSSADRTFGEPHRPSNSQA